jgi:signal transduction histidine kinase
MHDLNPTTQYYSKDELLPSIVDFTDKEHIVLENINQEVAASPSLEDLIGFLFDQNQKLGECDRMSFAFIEEGGQRAIAGSAYAHYRQLYLGPGYSEDIRQGSLLEVIRKSTPRIIHDLKEYQREKPGSPSCKLLLKEGIRSSMTCPLSVDGKNVGILFRNSKKTNAFDLHQVKLYMAVAVRISQAVEKAYRIRRLEEANNAYTEMLAFVSHELKSPLSSIIFDSDVITKGYLGELKPEQQEKIFSMRGKASYLLSLVKEYLNLAKIESGQLELEADMQMNLVEDVIKPSIAIVSPQIEEKNISLQENYPSEPIAVTGDAELLKIVTINLLSNASKYGVEKGSIKLSVETSSDYVTLKVWNKGPGFPPDQKSRLFRKFSRLQSEELLKRNGTGVGLYTSWKIVRLHGGSISADSKAGHWAEFSVSLPGPNRN